MKTNVIIHESLWESRGDLFAQNFTNIKSIKETHKVLKKIPNKLSSKVPHVVFWPWNIEEELSSETAPNFLFVLKKGDLFNNLDIENPPKELDKGIEISNENISRIELEKLMSELFESWHYEYLKTSTKNLDLLCKGLEIDSQKRPPKALLDFFDELYDKICENLPFNKIIQFVQKAKVFSYFEIDQIQTYKSEDLYPVICENGENYFIEVMVDEDFLRWKNIAISSLISILKTYEEKNQSLKMLKQQGTDLEHVFRDLPFPTLILDEHGDLVIYNNMFLELNLMPEECKRLVNEAQTSISNKDFNVYKTEFRHKGNLNILIVLSPVLKGVDADTEQLGIVASSLAHEINNPMTGILAALSYFELSDDLSAEQAESLKELKLTVTRCQRLVETFLGFSRPNIESSLREHFEVAMDRAKELIRFRMIESNVQMTFNQLHSNYGGLCVNKSIMAIALYLIFCEIITAYSQFMLLSFKAENNSNNLVLNWSVTEFSVEIELRPSLSVLPAIEKNLLINNLLKMEGLEVIEDRNLVIRTFLS